MKFHVDFKLYGTAYAEADTREEAHEKFKAEVGNYVGLEFGQCHFPTGEDDVTISPVFTSHGGFELGDIEEVD